ncbi:MAG: orotate phosphoribosyltransferase [Chloroflexi bacterium]|nr:orotate phosphoribosyltransferase [Chloroflexota bacterium]
MEPDEVMGILKATGAVKEGHFQLASGRHSGMYVEKFMVLQYPQYTELLCKGIAEHFQPQSIEVVAGPTTGGIILSYETARQLGTRGIFAEREESGGRRFRRGFDIRPGERVLIVDDILTTGGSVREVVEAVERLQGTIVGIGVLVDRSNGAVDFGYPLYPLLTLNIETWQPSECPLCRQGIPLVKPGTTKSQ